MADVDDDEDFTPWTPEGAAALRAAAADLAAAVIAHAETVISMRPGAPSEEVVAASRRLVPTFDAWDNCLFEYSDTVFPFWDLINEDEDEDEDEEDAIAKPAYGVTVLQRTDFAVTDEDAVLRAGKAAYLRTWPEDSEEQAARDSNHLGAALYQVAHADGWHSLAKLGGLQPVGGQTVVLRQENLLGPDPDKWPDDLFENEGEVLFTQGDVFENRPRE